MGERTASSGRKLAGVWNSGLFSERVRDYVRCHQAAGGSKPTRRFEAFGTKRGRGRYSATAGLVGGWQLEMEDHQPDSRRQSHGFVAMKSLYRLDQFDRVLALRNRDGLPHLLIGSQAVKFWAGLFADQGIGPSRTEAVHQRRHGLQRRPGRCRTHCSATEAPRGSTREGWNDRPGRLHPLHMGRHRVQHRSRPSGSWCASEPGEPGDPGRGERSNPSGHGPGLPVCLEVGALLHGFSREPARHPAPESLSENSEGSCGEGIWRWPRRRGRSIPE